MRAIERKNTTVTVDGYTRVCLTVIAVLLTVLIVGLWAEDVSPASDAHAAQAKAFLDSSAQRKAMLKAQEQTNAKLDELTALFRSGDAKVQLAGGAAERSGGKDARSPGKRK